MPNPVMVSWVSRLTETSSPMNSSTSPDESGSRSPSCNSTESASSPGGCATGSTLTSGRSSLSTVSTLPSAGASALTDACGNYLNVLSILIADPTTPSRQRTYTVKKIEQQSQPARASPNV